MSLRDIKNFNDLDDYIFENEVDLRCKESGLSIASVEPTEEGEEMAVVLSDGTEVAFTAEQLIELFEAIRLN